MIEQYLAFISAPCPLEIPALINASQKLLGEKRFRHVQGVHRAALSFAELFALDRADTLRLEQAVWLHDFAKGLPLADQQNLAQRLSIPLPEESLKAPAVVHAVIGAWMVSHVFNLKDASLEAAVFHHTTGHLSLDLTGRLLFLADYCEEGRGFDCTPITGLLPLGIERALYLVVKEKIIAVLQKNHYVHSASIAFYHSLLPNAPQ